MMASQRINELPTTLTEECFSALIALLGTFAFAYIVGSVGVVFDSDKVNVRDHQARINFVLRFLRQNKISKKLENQVLHYFNFEFTCNRGFNAPKMINTLPPQLRDDIFTFMYRPVLEKVEFFQDIDINVLIELMHRMETKVFVPGELLAEHGKKCQHISFVTQGLFKIEAKGRRKDEQVSLIPGDYYGAHEIFINLPNSDDVRAQIYSEILSLSVKNLDDVCTEPDTGIGFALQLQLTIIFLIRSCLTILRISLSSRKSLPSDNCK